MGSINSSFQLLDNIQIREKILRNVLIYISLADTVASTGGSFGRGSPSLNSDVEKKEDSWWQE